MCHFCPKRGQLMYFMLYNSRLKISLLSITIYIYTDIKHLSCSRWKNYFETLMHQTVLNFSLLSPAVICNINNHFLAFGNVNPRLDLLWEKCAAKVFLSSFGSGSLTLNVWVTKLKQLPQHAHPLQKQSCKLNLYVISCLYWYGYCILPRI